MSDEQNRKDVLGLLDKHQQLDRHLKILIDAIHRASWATALLMITGIGLGLLNLVLLIVALRELP